MSMIFQHPKTPPATALSLMYRLRRFSSTAISAETVFEFSLRSFRTVVTLRFRLKALTIYYVGCILFVITLWLFDEHSANVAWRGTIFRSGARSSEREFNRVTQSPATNLGVLVVRVIRFNGCRCPLSKR